MPDSALTFWTSFLVLLAAAWIDLRERRIPNSLVGPYLVAGFAARGFAGGDAVLTGVSGLALAGFAAGGLHLLTGLGMGDVKLLSAFGWWVGPVQLHYALPAVALAGGVWALGFLAIERLLGRLNRRPGKSNAALGSAPSARTMPYAPAIAVGAMFSFFAH